ncbi:MAG TPA: hypothetical protein VGR21_04035, partial [Cryptosporangiaceae bacterium]|nr:hypothetical protein [Cryptosporangiaceae bacterium]
MSERVQSDRGTPALGQDDAPDAPATAGRTSGPAAGDSGQAGAPVATGAAIAAGDAEVDHVWRGGVELPAYPEATGLRGRLERARAG